MYLYNYIFINISIKGNSLSTPNRILPRCFLIVICHCHRTPISKVFRLLKSKFKFSSAAQLFFECGGEIFEFSKNK